MSELVGNPDDQFSGIVAQMEVARVAGFTVELSLINLNQNCRFRQLGSELAVGHWQLLIV